MDYQTISPPYWRGYILIECANGKTYKYVRNITTRLVSGGSANWKAGNYSSYIYGYIWGDSIGDTIGMTSDTAGRIMFDFNRLANIYTSQSSITGALMRWPEYTGIIGDAGSDTTALNRINLNQLQSLNASSPNDAGLYTIPSGSRTSDSNSYQAIGAQANTYLRIPVSQIQSFAVIQERIPDWYKSSILKQVTTLPPVYDKSAYYGNGFTIAWGTNAEGGVADSISGYPM
jgi:hypothetical protein